MKVKVHKVSAFTKNGSGGNLAGVVVDGFEFGEDQMQRIANEVGFSETAFIKPSQKADFKVRFFTPNAEVDICGHATIAAFHTLFKVNKISAGKYLQETKAGILNVEVMEDARVIMDQNIPTYGETYMAAEIAEILNIDYEVITKTEFFPQSVSTGLKDIFVCVDSREELLRMKPDLEIMKEFNKKTGTIGFHVFTLDVIDKESTAHSRNFCPLFDIPEESATGSSTGALACYLFDNGEIEELKLENLVFEQGYSMDNPSELIAKLELKKGKISKVKVGGMANIKEILRIEI